LATSVNAVLIGGDTPYVPVDDDVIPTIIVPGLFQSETKYYDENGNVALNANGEPYEMPFFMDTTEEIIVKAVENALLPIANLLISDNSYKIVLLAGPSGSGKTTTARKLSEKLILGGKNAVYVAGGGEYCLCGEGEDNVAVVGLAAEKDSALISALCADKVSVLYRPLACHYLPILLPVFVGLGVEKYGAFVKLYELAQKMKLFKVFHFCSP
jgi:hypothetical protein